MWMLICKYCNFYMIILLLMNKVDMVFFILLRIFLQALDILIFPHFDCHYFLNNSLLMQEVLTFYLLQLLFQVVVDLILQYSLPPLKICVCAFVCVCVCLCMCSVCVCVCWGRECYILFSFKEENIGSMGSFLHISGIFRMIVRRRNH